MMSNLFLLGIRYRAIVMLGVLVMTLFTAAGLNQLEFDTGFNSLIPSDEPERLVYRRVMDEFGSDNKTIIYIRDEHFWSPEKLALVDKLQRELKKIPYITSVDSPFSIRVISGERDQDGSHVVSSQQVLNGVPETQLEADQAKARALSNPLYIGNLFSSDGAVSAIIVTAIEAEDEQDFSIELYQLIEDLLDKNRGEFEQIFQVGPPRVTAELRDSLAEDFAILGPLSALVLVLSILFFMKSPLAAAVPLLTSVVTIIWTFGVMGWLGIPLNILSAMIPSLIIVIGSTEDTHMMAAFFRGLAIRMKSSTPAQVLPVSHEDRLEAIRYMSKHTGLPMMLTILTTALGFGSNLFGNILLIQHFAMASTMAIVFNGVITILLVPPLLALFGSSGVAGKSTGEPDRTEALYKNNLPDRIIKTFRISQDHFPLYTLGFTLILCIFFTYQAGNLYVTNDPMSYFPEDRPLVQDTRVIHEDLAGIKIFFISLESRKNRAFMEPSNLERLSAIQSFLDKQGVYDTSISLADHLKYVESEFRGGFGDSTLPQTRQLVAQYLLFFHRSELESYVSHDFRRANIIVRHNINDSHTLNQYINELKIAVQDLAGPDIEAVVVGENLLVNQAAETLMLSQVKALILLLALIFVLMSIMFTSLKGGAIAMIPSLIPIVLMFGLMGFLEIPLNPGTAMVAVIAVGIAIDGTVHLLARYNELCRATSDYEGAVHEAVQEVATPLIVSSLALALGFGILLFSNFTVVAQFGALAAFTMLVSIFANLLITPIVMTRVRLVGLYQIISMNVDDKVLETSPLFQGMTRYQRRKAILISEIHEFAEGEKLVTQGDVGRNMYMILEGNAEVIRHDGESERLLASLAPGDIFGEVGYIRAIERTADVIAMSHVSVLNFDYERMQKDLRFFPNIVAKLNFNISGILGGRLADVLDSQ